MKNSQEFLPSNRDSSSRRAFSEEDDERKLFVGGIGQYITDRHLHDHFSKFGNIESIDIKLDPYTGQSKGFAFIRFSNSQTVEDLLSVGEHVINNKKVDAKRVTKQRGKLFVGGLTSDTTEQDIRDYFCRYGTILELRIPFDNVSMRRKNFCFITFDSKHVVHDLVNRSDHVICGKLVDARHVRTPNRVGIAGRGHGSGYNGRGSRDYEGYGAYGGEYGGYGGGYGYGSGGYSEDYNGHGYSGGYSRYQPY